MTFTSKFKALNFFTYFGFATLGTMSIPFFISKGFSYAEIGLITSMLPISAFISNNIIGYICDRFGTIKKVYIPSAILCGILFGVLFISPTKPIFMLSYIAFGFFQSIVLNLNDSWVIEYSEHSKKRFGPIRSFGSLGWALCSLCIGYLVDLTGFYIIAIIGILMMMCILCVAIRTNDCQKKPSKINYSDFFKLIKRPNYLVFLICLLVFGIANNSIGVLPTYIIKNLGGNNSTIGIYYFLCATSEIIVLIFSVKILKNISAEKLMILCSSTLIIRFLIMFLANNIVLFNLSALLHMFTFGGFLISSKKIIDKLTPDNFKTTGNMLWATVYSAMSSMISSYLTGYLMGSFGIKITEFVYIIIASIATLLLLIYNNYFKTNINVSI